MLNGLDKIDLTAPDAIEQINALAAGLISKNTELLGKKEGKDALTAAERAKLTALEASDALSQIEKAKAANDWAEADRLKDEANATRFEALTNENNGYKQSAAKQKITDGITLQFEEIKLDPKYARTTRGFFESQSEVIDGKAMIGDKTQSEYIKEWSQSDEGKAYCLAPINSGGDANGTGTTPPQGAPVNKAAEAAQKSGNLDAYLAATMQPVV